MEQHGAGNRDQRGQIEQAIERVLGHPKEQEGEIETHPHDEIEWRNRNSRSHSYNAATTRGAGKHRNHERGKPTITYANAHSIPNAAADHPPATPADRQSQIGVPVK